MTQTTRLALLTFVIGFLVEGATELYQFVSYGYDSAGWIGFYYIGLATTGIGFYLMYRGRHEWTHLHHVSVRRGHQFLWTAIGIFVGASVVIAVVGLVAGGPGARTPPAVLGWFVGGLVALAFGNFFLGLRSLVDQIVRRWGAFVATTAFVWSLGVAVLTGYLVGGEFLTLVREFFTNPLGLIVSFAPLAFVMAPLFVTYFLFAAAYFGAFLLLRSRARAAGAAPAAPSAGPAAPPAAPAGPTGSDPDGARANQD